MDLFITCESTRGIDFSDLQSLFSIGDVFNEFKLGVEIQEILCLCIIFIIMDPAIAAPFAEGMVYRRSKSNIDARIKIDFSTFILEPKSTKPILALRTAQNYFRLNSINSIKRQTINGIVEKLELAEEIMLKPH